MKTLKLSMFILSLGLSSSLLAQGNITVEDDIYVKKGEENAIVQMKKKDNRAIQNQAPAQSSAQRDVDEYNRRYNPDNQDNSESKDVANNEEAQEGEYVNGFKGSQSDYEYAERIRRFHNPRFLVHISNPAYSDIYFLNSYDWNVYTDGNYAFVTPTWTNHNYFNYMYSPFSYGSPWGYGGYGSCYNPWYSGYGYYGGYNHFNNYGYGYGGYGGGYYGNYYGGGYGNYGGYYGSNYAHTTYNRYDGGRRNNSTTTGSRSSRYDNSASNSPSRSSNSAVNTDGRSSRYSTTNPTVGRATNSDNSTYNSGRSGRFTTVPSSSRYGSDNASSESNNSGRTYRNSQPAGTVATPSADRTSRVSETPISTNRTNYSTGSSSNNNRSTSTPASSGSSSSGRSSSYSTPSYDSGSSSRSSSSSSYSSGSSSSSSNNNNNSGGGGRSSGGRR